VAEGDLVVLHDTGAYYFSAPWAYNSLPRPGVYGFVHRAGDVSLTTIRTPQTLDEVARESGLSHADTLLTASDRPGPPLTDPADGRENRLT
jgi:diaminopimelate decarboxylase